MDHGVDIVITFKPLGGDEFVQRDSNIGFNLHIYCSCNHPKNKILEACGHVWVFVLVIMLCLMVAKYIQQYSSHDYFMAICYTVITFNNPNTSSKKRLHCCAL